ncbi:hypothetical protein Acr_26g0010720 [Actinidia rufa]|uniref:Uncharacterized protein n=1 Tax=Actinidia rufa TaxID=165716 RepID=A0A7J0H428_9ERIC|nr:hypothetical protein Acr_26g0010720 [Actinidia rufa]
MIPSVPTVGSIAGVGVTISQIPGFPETSDPAALSNPQSPIFANSTAAGLAARGGPAKLRPHSILGTTVAASKFSRSTAISRLFGTAWRRRSEPAKIASSSSAKIVMELRSKGSEYLTRSARARTLNPLMWRWSMASSSIRRMMKNPAIGGNESDVASFTLHEIGEVRDEAFHTANDNGAVVVEVRPGDLHAVGEQFGAVSGYFEGRASEEGRVGGFKKWWRGLARKRLWRRENWRLQRVRESRVGRGWERREKAWSWKSGGGDGGIEATLMAVVIMKMEVRTKSCREAVMLEDSSDFVAEREVGVVTVWRETDVVM